MIAKNIYMDNKRHEVTIMAKGIEIMNGNEVRSEMMGLGWMGLFSGRSFARSVFMTVLALVMMFSLAYVDNAFAATNSYYVTSQASSWGVGADGAITWTALADTTATGTNVNRMGTTTTAPTGTTRYRCSQSASGTYTNVELMRYYTPAYTSAQTLSANITFHVDAYMRTTGTSASFAVSLYDYNPAGASGNGVQIGTTQTVTMSASSTALQSFNGNFANTSYSIVSGHRLEVRMLMSSNASRPALLLGQAASATPSGNVYITVTETAGGNTTTVGNGTEPGNASVAPGGAATMLDAFTLQTSTGTDSVTAATVTLAAGTNAALSLVEITNDAGSTVYGSAANPASTTVAITLSTPITATATSTQYKVRVTPKAHASMPAVPGSSYSVTGTVTALTSTNTKTYSDAGSSTVTVDNLSPSNPTGLSGTAGDTQVALTWTNPADADFSEVVVLRKSVSAITDTPVEGTAYVAPAALGASTIVYSGALQSFTDTGLTNGTAYYYKIFAKDSNGNYSSAGLAAGPYSPVAPPCTITTCTGCHANPPADGTRNATTGAVVGSHSKHVTTLGLTCNDCHIDSSLYTTGHRNTNVEMAAAIRSGTYSKGASFAQVSNPTTGTCNNTVCHYSASPSWGSAGPLACNSCHGYPPVGAGVVNHGFADNGATLIANHDGCMWCHLTKDSGTGTHQSHANYSATTMHTDGNIQMNSAVSYDTVTRGCNGACHANDAAHRLPTASGKTVVAVAGDAPTACNSCHGYPPTNLTSHASGATAVNHANFADGGAAITSQHDQCVTCHGTKDSGTSTHAPYATYNPTTMHRDGNIQMNSTTVYNSTNFGCDSACHANDATHRLTDSALPVAAFAGSSGSCEACHDSTTPATGAPGVYPAQFNPTTMTGGVHRVAGAGTVTPKSTKITAGTILFVTNPWMGAVTKDSVMTCSDCHDTNGPDGLGVHKSGRSITDTYYLLRYVNNTINTTQSGTAMGAPNNTLANIATTASTKENLCINCHRADVYGTGSGVTGFNTVPANRSLSAIQHYSAFPISGDPCGRSSLEGQGNTQRVGCYNCHGGMRVTGGLHGTNRAVSAVSGSPITGWTGASTGFVNGDAWSQQPTNTGCYASNTGATTWSTCNKGTHNN
ncbi:MAG: hypothetical protein HZA20_02650 [Nitrospirae bacterium]|nr:hypothetical protein [Nitrospirota bacterium]